MRRFVAGVAAVSLGLALGSLPALAQADAVRVTSTQECTLGTSPVQCTYTADDPRVAGSGSHVFTESVPAGYAMGDIGFFWTDTEIQGPDGAWSGHHYIVTDRTGTAHALMMLAGEGAYEGWAYVASGVDPEADADHEFVGVIYEGPLPPVGSVVSMPAE